MCILQRREVVLPAGSGCAQAGCRECLERLLEQQAGPIRLIVGGSILGRSTTPVRFIKAESGCGWLFCNFI